MDKRWIAILVILLVGVTCMYLIIDSSNTVGSAIVDVNKSIVTMPDGFSKGDSDSNSVYLINKNTDESINIQDLGKTDVALDEFDNKFATLSHKYGIEELSNSSNVTKDNKVYTLCYKNTTENELYKSISYLYAFNHTFCIKMFNFDNTDKLNRDLYFIVDTIQPDYKKSQD